MVINANSFKVAVHTGLKNAASGMSVAANKVGVWGSRATTHLKGIPGHIQSLSGHMKDSRFTAAAVITGTSVGLFGVAHGINSLIDWTITKIDKNKKFPVGIKILVLGGITGAIQLGGLIGLNQLTGYGYSKLVIGAFTVGAIAVEILIRVVKNELKEIEEEEARAKAVTEVKSEKPVEPVKPAEPKEESAEQVQLAKEELLQLQEQKAKLEIETKEVEKKKLDLDEDYQKRMRLVATTESAKANLKALEEKIKETEEKGKKLEAEFEALAEIEQKEEITRTKLYLEELHKKIKTQQTILDGAVKSIDVKEQKKYELTQEIQKLQAEKKELEDITKSLPENKQELKEIQEQQTKAQQELLATKQKLSAKQQELKECQAGLELFKQHSKRPKSFGWSSERPPLTDLFVNPANTKAGDLSSRSPSFQRKERKAVEEAEEDKSSTLSSPPHILISEPPESETSEKPVKVTSGDQLPEGEYY